MSQDWYSLVLTCYSYSAVEKSRYPPDRDIVLLQSAATELYFEYTHGSAVILYREVFPSKGEAGICAELSLNTWMSQSKHTVKMWSDLSFVLLLARMVTNVLFQYERL